MSDLEAEIWDWAGIFVRDLVVATRDPATATILDVGAGQGKYARLLAEFTCDAVEAWQPTVDEWMLHQFYRTVFVEDVFDLVLDDRWNELRYDVIIFGDVLEHLTVTQARVVLDHALARASEVIVVVPYLYAQGAEHGNDFQRHLQPDLTPEVVASRYPELELVALETRNFTPFKGIYRGRT